MPKQILRDYILGGSIVLYLIPISLILIIYGIVVLSGKSNIKDKKKNKIGGITFGTGIGILLLFIVIIRLFTYYMTGN